MQNICLRVWARGLRDQKKISHLRIPGLIPKGKERCRRPWESSSGKQEETLQPLERKDPPLSAGSRALGKTVVQLATPH